MIENIVSILNAKLQTTGRIDKRYCIAEKRERSSDQANIPYAYQGKGEMKAVNIDNPSLSWWRLTDAASFGEATTTSSVSKLTATYPLRLVVMFRRKDSTNDDSFSPAWLAEDISQLLTFSNGELKTGLKASDVRVNVTSTDFDTTSVWGTEFEGLEFKDPKYKTALIALELSVVVTALKSCWEDECDYDSDILHLFNFCDQGTVDRLTDEQQQCLIDALCTCADANIQINGTPFTTVASGGTYDQSIHDTAGTDVGTAANPSVIGDSSNEVNGVDISEPTVAEGTHNQQIHNSAASDVGTAANPSVVSDATVTINGDSLGATGDVVAEGSVDIDVQQGGSPVGSWTGTVWDVPASSCGSTAAQLKTGQTVSYATGDDGDLQEGREVDFTTLNENNYFGNTNRFTDELGTQVYTNNIAIDWSTYDQTTNNVTGWYVVKQSATPWATAITNCTSFSVGSFTSGWYLPNIRQYAQILDLSSTSRLNYSPFNITFGLLNSSTTYPSNTAQAWEGVAGGGSTPIFNRTKTINTEYLIARTFNTSEL